MTTTEDIQINGDKVRQLREERGWDSSQLARLSSLSVAQVQALESGSVACFYTLPIRNNAARKVAKVLGVPENEVITVIEKVVPTEQVQALPIQNAVIPKKFASNLATSTWMGYGVMSLGLVMAWVGYGMHQRANSDRPSAVMAATPTPTVPVASANQDSLPTTKTPAAMESTPLVDAPVAVAQGPQPAASAEASGLVSRAPAVEVEMTPASLNVDPACAFDADNMPLGVEHPTKSGEKVSLMFHKAGLLCVQDSTGKVWKEDLKPWVGRTFMGKAPWKLYSPVLSQADVYFQGEKIKVGSFASPAITLGAKPFNP